MKSLLAFLCVILACLCFGLSAYFLDTEYQVARWQARVSTSTQFEADIKHAAEQFEAVSVMMDSLTETASDLAAQNTILCQRDAKMVATVAAFEEENRRLTESLKDAVGNMQEQEKQINELIEKNEELRYYNSVLEREVDELEGRLSEVLASGDGRAFAIAALAIQILL